MAVGSASQAASTSAPAGVTAYTFLSGRPLWATSVRGDPAVCLHPREHAVDLLVGGVPEEADRPLEAPGQVEPGRGLLVEGDEKGVLEGHGDEGFMLCNELQAW